MERNGVGLNELLDLGGDMNRKLLNLMAQAICTIPLGVVLLHATDGGRFVTFCCGFVAWSVAGRWVDGWAERSNTQVQR